MTKNKNVPKLRFTGFEGEWSEKGLSSFLIPTLREIDKPSDNYLAIGIRSHCKGTFHKPDSDPEKIAMESLYVVKENDLIVNITFAWEGAIAIVQKEDDGGLVSHRFPTYVFDRKKVIHEFFQYVFVQKKFRLTLEIISPGGAGRNRVLSQKAFLKMRCHLPSFPEQQKIAAFLTAIDTRIQQLTRKKALLEQYKKGVMQKIFSQEIRFRDEEGKEYEEWETTYFGKIFSFYSTNSFSRALLNYEEGSVKNIHYGDIHTTFKTNFNLREEVVPFVNPDIDLSKIPEENYCKEGDLVIADASEDYTDVGKAIEIINLDGGRLLAGLHTYIARDKENKTAIGFKAYAMQTSNVRRQIMRLATGISVLSISKGSLSKIELDFPELPEQKKITAFLSALDSQITQVNQQLIHTQTYKKGLLQQMFV